MTKSYLPKLDGEGDSDYARYMRTDALLSLQRKPEEMIHHDELMFQILHQSTEIWLKLAAFELTESIKLMQEGEIDLSIKLLERSSLAVVFVTDQLDILSSLSPFDFQKFRPALGNGSGAESPGWMTIRKQGEKLNACFIDYLEKNGVSLKDVYQSHTHGPLYRLAEAMIGWDERMSLWRARHYKVAVRTLGHSTIGTKGMPTDQLAKFLNHKFFPSLWSVRTELTQQASSPS